MARYRIYTAGGGWLGQEIPGVGQRAELHIEGTLKRGFSEEESGTGAECAARMRCHKQAREPPEADCRQATAEDPTDRRRLKG
ncbi:putative response regulatory protein [Trichinella spiralis]|uniref:Response regulatory protein n=1 Tax=Trichinella spiralis TaxID=6334 RepID=A0ABR3KMH0_TRISP